MNQSGKYAKSTKVSIQRTILEIQKTLMRFGADTFAFIEQRDCTVIGFRCHNRNVRINVNYPAEPEGSSLKIKWKQGKRQKFRALLLVIKAKLVAVEEGVASFETEFLPYLVTSNGATIAEKIIPELDDFSSSGDMRLLTDGPGS